MILARLTSIEDVRKNDGEMYKYVRMADGSFRFADIQSLPEHRFMIDPITNEVAVSAGTVVIDATAKVAVEAGYGSATLGIARSMPDDMEKIEALLWGSQ